MEMLVSNVFVSNKIAFNVTESERFKEVMVVLRSVVSAGEFLNRWRMGSTLLDELYDEMTLKGSRFFQVP